jgi:lipoprotein NlpD
LIGRFGGSGVTGKGLDIAGRRGDSVLAAAPGVVVYAGSALVGYGRLLIIRHDDNYISAYAHNDRFLVKEGDRVRPGQVIAEMGASGADREKLHFEIRERGKPVDPLRFLPARE